MRNVSALVICLLFPLFAEGTIVFRSIAPGEVLDNVGNVIFQNLDLDGDGSRDFFTTTAGNELSIVPVGNNRVLSVVATLPDLGRSIAPLLGGEAINGSPMAPQSWNGLADIINEFDDGGSSIYKCNGRVLGQPPECISTIQPQVETFIGLELEKDGETHYGWVGITSFVSVFHDVQVTGWAYETDPDLAIMAGAVPEPSSLLCMLLSFPVLLRRRR